MTTDAAEADTSAGVIALVRDLILGSRITAVARQAGVGLITLRDPAALSGRVAPLLLVDLNLAGALEAAGAWRAAAGAGAGVVVVGFVAHTDQATIDRARAAGIDRIMARSGFVQELPRLLSPGSGGTAL